MRIGRVFGRAARRFGLLCTAGPVLVGSAWVELSSVDLFEMVRLPLEQRFQPAANLTGLTGVVALGGGEERIREACRLGQRYPHLQVFISGAGDGAKVRNMLGPELAGCELRLENKSYNTRSNAEFTVAQLKPAPDERWLLVTSAAHMPRAIGAFRKAGMNVAPWPVYERRGSSYGRMQAAGREWVGLVVYWLNGHTSELFPGPIEQPPAPIQSAMATGAR